MEYQTFTHGEECWIHVGAQRGDLKVTSKGFVIAKVHVPHLVHPLYLIQMFDRHFYHPECRSAAQMSKTADMPPPYSELRSASYQPVQLGPFLQ